MADKDFSLVRGRVLRVTKLDACGEVLPGPRNSVVTKGMISVGFSAQNDEGTTISQTNANGDTCIRDVPAPKFLNYTLELALCGVSPTLVSLLTGNDLVRDANDDEVGFDVGTDVDLDEIRFALELWSVVPGQNCLPGESRSYGYLLVPLIQGGQFGDFTWQNDAVNFTVSNAQTKDGNGWGVGPYDVQADETGNPGPLVTAINPNKHLRVIRTTVAPPAPSGVVPVGVAATGATAGVPGTYTPANSYGPENLAGATGLTASPNTAWTTGQYITLEDGSKAHWTGSAWAAGPA